MSRVAQAYARRPAQHLPRLIARLAAISACLTLAACGGGMSLSKIEADKSILTSAVAPDPNIAADPQAVSDQATIRNAVSSANLEEVSGPLAWANIETSSRGSIFDIVEVKRKSALCRSFKTSRESFEGVSIYSGETCTQQGGAWYMRIFKLL